MKRKLMLLVYLCTVCIYGYAELHVSLNVETPGSLSSMIASSRKAEITHLTLSGVINGSDILYIRQMAGATYNGTVSSSKCSLEFLDIANATIVEGGSVYSYYHDYNGSGYDFYNEHQQYRTQNNIVTPFMFDNCYKLKTLILPKTVTKIEENAFFDTRIQSITLSDNLEILECDIPSLYITELKIAEANQHFKVIDRVLYSSDMKTLYRCPVDYKKNIFQIPEGVELIFQSAFFYCMNIREFEIPSTLIKFGYHSLGRLQLDKFVLDPNIEYSKLGDYTMIKEVIMLDGYSTFDAASVLGRGSGSTSIAKDEVKVNNLKIYCITPPIIPDIWSSFNNATLTGNLYVPKGSYSAYYIAYGWGDFSHIYEMDDDDIYKKCAKPTISYSNSKLIFNCETNDVVFRSFITDSDIKSYNENEIPLNVTYTINVYATKTGYENSDMATATLCWIDMEPKTEGTEAGLAQVEAHAVLIQSNNGQIDITGLDDGTRVAVYSINGAQLGSTVSRDGYASINTTVRDSITIVKIGNRSIKVLMK